MTVPNLKLAIVGHGRSGKDTAAEWFRDHTPLAYTMSTSRILLPLVVSRLYFIDIDSCTEENYPDLFEKEWDRRHDFREFWFDTGIWARRFDPAFLARAAVARGQDIVVGIRDGAEIRTTRSEGLVDLVLWIDRDVPPDPTLTYGVEEADVVIPNRWGLDAFHGRLRRLARSLGLLPTKTRWPLAHPIQAAHDHLESGA